MPFDPITGVWAANKAAQKIGGSSGGASGDVWIDLADYGITLTSFYDDAGALKTTVSVPITEEQYYDLTEKMQNEKVVGFYFAFATEVEGVTYSSILRFCSLTNGLSPYPLAVCIAMDMEGGDEIEVWRIGSDFDDLTLTYKGKIAFTA